MLVTLQYIWIMYLFQGRNKLGATKFFGGLPWPAWQLTGPGPTRQAKFGHYLSGTKDPGSLSQTEEAVEREQV